MRTSIILCQIVLILLKVFEIYSMPWWVVLLPLLTYIIFGLIDYIFVKINARKN